MKGLKEKQFEIKSDYKTINKKSDSEVNRITNSILDVFDVEYAKLIKSNNPDFSELEEFMLFFVNGKFVKEIKFNILVYMGFMYQTELTKKIKNIIKEKYIK